MTFKPTPAQSDTIFFNKGCYVEYFSSKSGLIWQIFLLFLCPTHDHPNLPLIIHEDMTRYHAMTELLKKQYINLRVGYNDGGLSVIK